MQNIIKHKLDYLDIYQTFFFRNARRVLSSTKTSTWGRVDAIGLITTAKTVKILSVLLEYVQ